MLNSRLSGKLDKLEPLALAASGMLESAVYGVVDMDLNVVRKWKGTIGNMEETDDEPTILLAEAFERALLVHKKYKCFYGSRAGMKSIFGMDAMIGEVNSTGAGVFCLRERMKSIDQSIYRGIKDRINDLDFAGFTPIESKWRINNRNGGVVSFGGMANIRDMKSLFKYKFFLMEEAAKTSQETIDVLGPTLRGVDNAELWYLWNPESSSDPMSKEFIIPYQDEIDRNGYYEDEYHLIIKTTYRDNPWFFHDQSLRTEFEKDTKKYKNGLMSKARYMHIWEGEFSDAIENCLIHEDWFDAAVDAHKKLGWAQQGAIKAAFDPADGGMGDNMPIVIMQGNVVYYAEEITASNGNDGFDIACGIANKESTDVFGWDADGMGALLRNQAVTNFKGTKVETYMFKGSEGVHLPDAIFEHADEYGIKESKKNRDVFKNKRAQNYVSLAERFRKTYRAVEHGEYINPDELISISSEIKCLQKMRAEVCRLPIKPNSMGMIELYSKQDMKKGIQMPDGSKLKLPSPGLADDLMMLFDRSGIITHKPKKLPQSRNSWGRR